MITTACRFSLSSLLSRNSFFKGLKIITTQTSFFFPSSNNVCVEISCPFTRRRDTWLHFFFIMYNIVRVMTLCNKRATNYYRRSNCVLPKCKLCKNGAWIYGRRHLESCHRSAVAHSISKIERETRPSRLAVFVRLFVNVSFSFRKCLKKEFHIEMRFLIYIYNSVIEREKTNKEHQRKNLNICMIRFFFLHSIYSRKLWFFSRRWLPPREFAPRRWKSLFLFLDACA